MRESHIDQEILEEGRAEGYAEGYAEGRVQGCLTALLQLGIRKFGYVSPAVLGRLAMVNDSAELICLAERLMDVPGWDELLAGRPKPQPSTHANRH